MPWDLAARRADSICSLVPSQAGHIDEGVDDVQPLFCCAVDGGDVVHGGAHSADDAFGLVLIKDIQGLLMALQGIDALLLVEHEDVNIVPIQLPAGLLYGFYGHLAGIGVGFGGDDTVVLAAAAHGLPEIGIGLVELGGVEEGDAAGHGVGQDGRALVQGQVLLQGAHGERAAAEAGDGEAGGAKRDILHPFNRGLRPCEGFLSPRWGMVL